MNLIPDPRKNLIPDPRSLIPSFPRSLIPDPRSLIPSSPRSLIPDPRSLIPGFTLIEMLIVIGIIAILVAVMMTKMGGATEAAKLAQCQSNMKNLVAAACSFAVNRLPTEGQDLGQYPDAGTTMAAEEEVTSAWIGIKCSYLNNEKEVLHALTNGVLWKYVGRNRSIYQCPVHKKTCRDVAHKDPGWSYAMNTFFYTKHMGKLHEEGDNPAATEDRVLMFADIPGLTEKAAKKYCGSEQKGYVKQLTIDPKGELATNAVLNYPDGHEPGEECIGFNHVRNNRLVAPVAFADGHTEVLELPKNGSLEELTKWLCEGYSVSFDGRAYKKIEAGKVEED